MSDDAEAGPSKPKRTRKRVEPALAALRAYLRLMKGQPRHVHEANISYLRSVITLLPPEK